MKILFVGGEKGGNYIDVKLQDNGKPFHYWEVREQNGSSVVYKLKAICWSHGGLKHWEYHLL